MIDWERFYARFREPGFVPGFEIENRLGGGAFGEVYRARKVSIDKPYAIKFLKVDGEVERHVIEREIGQARLFAALDHPNLVTVEDVGTAEGVPYLVMGYAGEDTLARRLKRGPLEVPAAIALFTQICRGVLALHDRNLVHFDLKPANVFIKGDQVRVGDYGLAKLVADGRQTLSFGRGTPLYVAPEVLSGRADQRADIYSLGVILFECLAGKPPFSPDSGLGAILRRDEAPIRFPAEFPAALAAVVERCLAREPAQRYASVAELLEDLGQAARRGDSIRWPAAAPGGAAAASAAPPQATAPADVVEWETLGSDPAPAPTPLQGGGPELRAAPWSDRELSSTELPASGIDPLDAGLPAPAAAASAPLAWVPVPPRVEGGALGTLRALLRVGLDLFGVVVGNPVRATAGQLASRLAPATASLGRGLRSTLLWMLWLAGMALLGAVVVALLAALTE
jgi:tRNA A-37 threonylcarbamoyl transferase component Bud32